MKTVDQVEFSASDEVEQDFVICGKWVLIMVNALVVYVNGRPPYLANSKALRTPSRSK